MLYNILKYNLLFSKAIFFLKRTGRQRSNLSIDKRRVKSKTKIPSARGRGDDDGMQVFVYSRKATV